MAPYSHDAPRDPQLNFAGQGAKLTIAAQNAKSLKISIGRQARVAGNGG